MRAKHFFLLLIFGGIFLISAYFFVSYYFEGEAPAAVTTNAPESADIESDLNVAGKEESRLPLIFSALSAVASGGGFLVTTFFAIRRDRRAAELHALQIERARRDID